MWTHTKVVLVFLQYEAGGFIVCLWLVGSFIAHRPCRMVCFYVNLWIYLKFRLCMVDFGSFPNIFNLRWFYLAKTMNMALYVVFSILRCRVWFLAYRPHGNAFWKLWIWFKKSSVFSYVVDFGSLPTDHMTTLGWFLSRATSSSMA
jgi:hypothetical protein